MSAPASVTSSGQRGCGPAPSPMEQHLKLNNDTGTLISDPSSYRRMVGRLIHLAISRPDITYAVNILSQFMHAPRVPHLDVAHQILRYLKHTPSHGIFFPSSTSLTVTAYTESNWANCPMTHRSTSDFIIKRENVQFCAKK